MTLKTESVGLQWPARFISDHSVATKLALENPLRCLSSSLTISLGFTGESPIVVTLSGN